MGIGVEVYTCKMLGDLPSQWFAEVLGAVVGGIIGQVIFVGIWWFYFKKSVRVRNTYGSE